MAPSVGFGQWSIKTQPVGSTPSIATLNSINSTFSTGASQWGDYTLTWTVKNGIFCPPSTDDVVISFGAPPTGSVAGSNTNFCFPSYTLAGNTPSIGTGAWSKITVPGTANFSNVNSPTSTVTVSLPGTYDFRWTISSGSCTPSTSDVYITFDPLPTASAGPDIEICSTQNNVALNGSQISGNTGTLFWAKVSGGSGVGFTPSGNILNPSYTPTTAERNAGSVLLTFNVPGLLTCASQTVRDTMKLTLDALPVINAGTDANVCGLGYTLAATKNIGNGTWSRVAGVGAGNVTFGTPSSGSSTVTVDKYDTYQFVWTVTNLLCTVTDTVSVRFYEDPTPLSAGSTINVCALTTNLAGTAHAYLGGLNNNSGSTRSWSLTGVNPVTAAYVAPSSPTTQVTVSAYGTYTFRWTETNGPCSRSSNVTVNFYQNPSVAITPATPASVCQGTSLQLNGNPTQGSGTSFSSHVWTDASNILSSKTIQNPVITNTAAPGSYILTYTVTDNNTCTASGNITVNVNPLASITVQPVSVAACELSNTSFSLTASGNTLAYQWQVNPGSGYVNLVNDATYSGVTTSSIAVSNLQTTLNGNKYRCMLTTFGGSCTTYSNQATLTVNPLAVITSQPTNAAVCEGGGTSFSVIVSPTGSPVYKWQENRTGTWNNLSDGGIYSGTSTATLNLTGIPIGMNAYQYRCSLITTGSCSRISNAVTLTVNANPVISVQPVNAEVCQGSNRSFFITASGPGLAYQWQVKNGGSYTNINNAAPYSGSATNTLQITSATSGINNSIYLCQLTTTGNCQLSSNSVSLTVTSPVSLNAGSTGEVCSNVGSYTIQVASGASASNYSTLTWASNGSGTFTNPNVTYATYNLSAADRSSANLLFTLTAQPNGSCAGASSSMTLNITPAPVVNAGSDQEICEGTAFNFINSTIAPAASNYTALLWSKPVREACHL